ncbi:MAG: hypothetical protein AAGH82_05850 [Pseudomonadota bacterium]
MTQKLQQDENAVARGSNGPLARLVDFARYRNGTPPARNAHPLVAASMALGESPRARARTANLVSLLMTHASRSRRKSQPRAEIRMCVVTPNGVPAVKLRLR